MCACNFLAIAGSELPMPVLISDFWEGHAMLRANKPMCPRSPAEAERWPPYLTPPDGNLDHTGM